MKIGLYSEVARQNLVAGFSLISEKGYSTSAEDIRRCRQDIIEMAENGNTQMKKISDSNDFFSTSECRDLLFHVQEKRLTLPQIEAALTSLQLEFLGFEIQNRIVERKFKESHANNGASASLPLWHKFEVEHPDTFIGMYQFWCKRL